MRVLGSAQSPVAVEAAPTSRPARKRKAQCSVTLCPWSRGTLLMLPLRTGRRLGGGWLDSPRGGSHGLACLKAQLDRAHHKPGGMGLRLAVPGVGRRYAGNALPTTLPARRRPGHRLAPGLDGAPPEPYRHVATIRRTLSTSRSRPGMTGSVSPACPSGPTLLSVPSAFRFSKQRSAGRSCTPKWGRMRRIDMTKTSERCRACSSCD